MMELMVIEEKFEEIKLDFQDLLDAIHYLRVNKDHEIIKEYLDKNKIIDVHEDSKFFEKISTTVTNEIKNQTTLKYEKLEKEILKRKKGLKVVSYKDVTNMINELYKDDEHNLQKYLLSITLVNSENKYKYSKESEKYISVLLWNDENFLDNIKKSYKETYFSLGNTALTSEQKMFIGIATAAILLTAIAVAPLTLGSAIVGAISAPLAIGSFLATGAVTGLTAGISYATMKLENKVKLKSDFKKLKFDEITYVLTLKAMLLEYAHKSMTQLDFKEYLNDTLLLTSDLKADMLYCGLVEKEDISKNENASEVFYKFDKRLYKTFTKNN